MKDVTLDIREYEVIHTQELESGEKVEYFASPLDDVNDTAWISSYDLMRVAFGLEITGFETNRRGDPYVFRVIKSDVEKVQIIRQSAAIKILRTAADMGLIDDFSIRGIMLGFCHATIAANHERDRYDVFRIMMESSAHWARRPRVGASA
ncbi:hypothetical protein V5F49_12990 [Xanthobacter sp. V3C-3]|uniref:hypothetical protein n=1 Tax=Xanthobacter lutulentifluminis TaxID=3119935 RepID=UPI003728A868